MFPFELLVSGEFPVGVLWCGEVVRRFTVGPRTYGAVLSAEAEVASATEQGALPAGLSEAQFRGACIRARQVRCLGSQALTPGEFSGHSLLGLTEADADALVRAGEEADRRAAAFRGGDPGAPGGADGGGEGHRPA